MILKIYTVFNPGSEGVVHSYLGIKGKSSWALEGPARSIKVLADLEKRGYRYELPRDAEKITGVPFKKGTGTNPDGVG